MNIGVSLYVRALINVQTNEHTVGGINDILVCTRIFIRNETCMSLHSNLSKLKYSKKTHAKMKF